MGTVLQWYGKTHTLSEAALSLLDGMLAIDQSCRLSPKAILEHAWFSAATAPVRATRSPVYRTRGRAVAEEEQDETNVEAPVATGKQVRNRLSLDRERERDSCIYVYMYIYLFMCVHGHG